MPTVLFDGDCKLCSMLAGYAERRVAGSMRFVSWQNYLGSADAGLDAKMFKKEAVVLRVLVEDETLDGPLAWSYLLREFPDLSVLNWLAEKLGIHLKTAQALQTAGGFARRLCRRCRPSLISRV